MYVETIPNRGVRPTVLLREAWREGKRIRRRTVGNITALPAEQIDQIRRTLKGEALVSSEDAFEILRSRPHGHVAAVVGVMNQLGLAQLLSTRKHRARQLVLAMIAARILEPDSKLATARQLGRDTLSNSLGDVLGVENADAEELYAALDWLSTRQPAIEQRLARRHLEEGRLVLWDVSGVRSESRHSPLVAYGRPKRGKSERQVLFGLLCSEAGVPVAVEAFRGNTGDPTTVSTVVARVRRDFGLAHVVVVGDRGMVTDTQIEKELRPQALDWITSLRAPTIQRLHKDGPLQLTLFDQRDLAEMTSPEFPGERLIACRNPLLAEDRARTRRELLAVTEPKLQAIVDATRRKNRPLRGRDRIGVRVGRVLEKSKVSKHFRYQITDDAFTFERAEASIHEEAMLDGIYVLRTSLTADQMAGEDVVRGYKRLAEVEQAFRVSKDFALGIEPIRHWREDRVRAHFFLCMLALYVRVHMEQALAPILFVDHDPQGADALKPSVVAKATISKAAARKKATKRTDDGLPVQSFASLLKNLATLTKNTVRVGESAIHFEQYARPTPLQAHALDLLGVSYRP
jgi:hypothetical protein